VRDIFRNSFGICPSSRIWRRLVFQWTMYAYGSRLNCSYESNSRSRSATGSCARTLRSNPTWTDWNGYRENLAKTGVAVIGVVLAMLACVAAGIAIIGMRRKTKE
jgi:hypothetical protein